MDHKQDKRALLMEKAVELYAQEGRLSIRGLAAAAGMNVASVNYYFGNKQNLMDQIIRTLIDSFQQLALAAEKDPAPPRERFCRLLCETSRRMVENPGAARLFYNLIGSHGGELDAYLSQALGPQSPLYRVICSIIASETGLTDPQELNSRFLITICAIVPSFVMGLGPLTGERFFSQSALSPFSAESYASALTRVILSPAAAAPPRDSSNASQIERC